MKKTSTVKKAQMGASTPALPSMSKKIKGIMNPAKSSKPTRSTLPNKFKEKPVYEGSTLPEYTVTAPKAKAGKSLGMKSVKAGYDNNPGVTRADIISAAKMKGKKAMYGTKVAGKKPIKKAQEGTTQYMELPEFTKTASKLNPMEKKKGRNYRPASNRIGKQMAKSQYGKGPYGRKRFQEGGDATKETSQFMELPEFTKTDSRIVDKPSKSKPYRTQKSKPAKRSVQSVKTFRQKGSGPGSGLMKLKQRITRSYKEGGEVEMAKKGASVKKAIGKCKYGC